MRAVYCVCLLLPPYLEGDGAARAAVQLRQHFNHAPQRVHRVAPAAKRRTHAVIGDTYGAAKLQRGARALQGLRKVVASGTAQRSARVER